MEMRKRMITKPAAAPEQPKQPKPPQRIEEPALSSLQRAVELLHSMKINLAGSFLELR